MSSRLSGALFALVLAIAVAAFPPVATSLALAGGCISGFVRSSIAGEGSRVKLGLRGRDSGCSSSSTQKVAYEPQPYFTYEVSCSTNRQAAAEGLCSATPCPDFGRFFAFRTIHHPDGSSGPAGFSCVNLEQAVAAPGVTVAQVFEAVRRVKLPGGEIGVEPGVRGLANLQSFFWVEGSTSRRSTWRWAGRRCMRSFGCWSTGGRSGMGSRW